MLVFLSVLLLRSSVLLLSVAARQSVKAAFLSPPLLSANPVLSEARGLETVISEARASETIISEARRSAPVNVRGVTGDNKICPAIASLADAWQLVSRHAVGGRKQS